MRGCCSVNVDEGASHLGEAQGVQSDPQNRGPRGILDLPEDPDPLLL